jgi:transposase
MSLDRETLRAAAVELSRRQGLKPRDIAELLGVSEAAVRDLLRLPPQPTPGGVPTP